MIGESLILTGAISYTPGEALILREQMGRALTNEELDGNFVFLNTRANQLVSSVDTLNSGTIPALQEDYNTKLGLKQPLNAKLSSIANTATNGLLSIDSATNIVVPRTLLGSDYVTITNGDGVNGNLTVSVTDDVAIINTPQILSNKTIDGDNNSIRNVSLTTAVKGTLPISSGGTNATTVSDARASLNVLVKPSSNGFVVKTNTDSSETRIVQVSGVGLSVTNPDGVSGNITINTTATSANVPSTPIARDINGNFSASMITANVTGNVTGNADTVTNGIYNNQFYTNPSWLASLSGTKVYNVPNSSLDHSIITINGTDVPLGGSFTFDAGSVNNVANTVVKRDASGNFAAGTITATLNGNALTATNADTAAKASRLTTVRKINNVNFDGTSNITVYDGSKLPLVGGIMQGPITLPGDPTQDLHTAPKQYVDSNDLDVHYGTLTLSSIPEIGIDSVDIFPPAGKTMADLKGFLPAMGSSSLSTPVYSTNLILVIDISNSMFRRHFWNGYWHNTAYLAAGKAGQALINHYSQLGPVHVCIVFAYNGYRRYYKWFDTHYDASAALNTVIDWSGIDGSVIDAHDARPQQLVAHTAVHFITDAYYNYGVFDAFGGSLQAWRNYLNLHRAICHSVCIHEEGLPSYINPFAWDGILRAEIRAFRALLDYDLPRTYFPGIYNTASIHYTIMSDRIQVSLVDGVEADMAPVNWLALWKKG